MRTCQAKARRGGKDELSKQAAIPQLSFSTFNARNENYALGSRFARPASRLVLTDPNFDQEINEFLMTRHAYNGCVQTSVIGLEQDFEVRSLSF
jgi:hypothetical protein